MNKIVKISAIILSSIGTFLGCSYGLSKSPGKIEIRTFDVSNFKEVVLEGPIQATITHSAECKVEVTLNSNLYSELDVHVTKGVLYVLLNSDKFKEEHTCNILVKAPFISNIDLSNLKQAEISGFFDKNADMNLAYTGSGIVTLNTIVRKLQVNVAGSGDVVVHGRSDYFIANIVGAGNLRAFNTMASLVSITSKSSGNAEITSKKGLMAAILSSGNIIARGTVDKLIAKISGSGTLKAFDTKADNVEIFCNSSGNAEITVEKNLNVRLTGSGGVQYYTSNSSLKRKIKRFGTGKVKKVSKKSS